MCLEYGFTSIALLRPIRFITQHSYGGHMHGTQDSSCFLPPPACASNPAHDSRVHVLGTHQHAATHMPTSVPMPRACRYKLT